jgi:DNA repair exonuclease SbcCD nuclease subunit
VSRRFLLFSDAHLDSVTAGVPRFKEIAACFDTVVNAAITKRADAVLFLGDLCDPDSVCAHAAAQEASRAAVSLAVHGIQSRWLVGNHDVVEDGTGSHVMSALMPLNELIREPPNGPFDSTIAVYAQPSIEHICGDGGGWLIALPYVARSQSYDPEEVIRTMAPVVGSDPVLVISHLMIEGIGPGSETTNMARGRDVFLPTRAIRLSMGATIASGHYHAPQTFDGVHVVGSLVRHRLDEAANDTGFLLIDF